MKSQIETAKKHIRELKKISPYLFVQYLNYIEAKKAYHDAMIKYENAKAIWNNLGEE